MIPRKSERISAVSLLYSGAITSGEIRCFLNAFMALRNF